MNKICPECKGIGKTHLKCLDTWITCSLCSGKKRIDTEEEHRVDTRSDITLKRLDTVHDGWHVILAISAGLFLVSCIGVTWGVLGAMKIPLFPLVLTWLFWVAFFGYILLYIPTTIYMAHRRHVLSELGKELDKWT